MKTLVSLLKAVTLGAFFIALACTGTDGPSSTDDPDQLEQRRQRLMQDRGDMDFILAQIEIAEAHADGGDLATLVLNPLLPFGLRTVDGTFNNVLSGQEGFGAADRIFPRLASPVFRNAEGASFDPDGPGPLTVGSPTSYSQTRGLVFDSQPRLASNLIADQSASNPAAVAAAAQTDGSLSNVDGKGGFFIPNVATDMGLSAPYNSWLTLFGQFFDHGLDLVKKGGSGAVFIPLHPDDPLYVDGGTTNFMVLTRATNQPGPNGILGDGDDEHEHRNETTSWVDQNQTYTSHPSHQVFLRDYALNASGKPVATGKMIDGARGGIGNWNEVKAQASTKLGIALVDMDVHDVPLLQTDAYGKFIRGPNGFPLMGTTSGTWIEGNPAAPISTANARRTGHAFLNDIAHSAAPRATLSADTDTIVTPPPQPANTYDDELLGIHFCTGDGRGNENIGLTAVHSIFHAEHNRLVGHAKTVVLATANPAYIAQWLNPGAVQTDGIDALEWNGERLFQAARFATEMQYQHLVFEEFARKVQPATNLFIGYDTTIDPAIMAEFAHTVYRFGHSLLNEDVARTNADGSRSDITLIQAFLNPAEFSASGTTDMESTAAIIRGMSRQRGNELDEFVTGALRNSLLGLPLDLPAINLARGRDTGVPSLNRARELFYSATSNSALMPYQSWADFAFSLRHTGSLANFIAAYGTHPDIVNASTVAARRAAALEIVNTGFFMTSTTGPADSSAFIRSTGAWATSETGLNLVDFWIGGLAEKQMVLGGLLGSSFNYVFETQMEKLQDGDRLYYLSRTANLNFLNQLEENSFAELVMRNTSVKHLPMDIFSLPAFVFEVGNIGISGAIVDDPATPGWNESSLLIRMPDGTVRYTGPEHVVFGGTTGNDRLRSSEGDDTVWGDEGDDRIEGGDGNDALIGGAGDDIITDLNGIDVIKGGPGNDVISAGPGVGDLILGGLGHDFVVAGADPKETFGGQGNDFIIAGDALDIVFGNEGDDWIEGGDQADLLQGDNGDPFQASPIVGNDVIIGNGGNDDYDSESGDDIMVSDQGVERHEGMLGFDWVTYKGNSAPVDADMRFTGLLPPSIDALRDRFDLTEGLSGWSGNDKLRGDSMTAADMIAMDPQSNQNNSLNSPTQIALIDGLSTVLPPGATSFTGGNIILGGAGSDLLEGRGGDDLLDGDAWLNVRISIRDAANVEIGRAETMQAVITAKSGALVGTPSTLTLSAAMFAGTLKPGQLRIVREILLPSSAGATDTAVFSEVAANYDLTLNADGTINVAHARPTGRANDGIDRLRGVEVLQFADGNISAATVVTPTDIVAPGPVTALTVAAGDALVDLTFAVPVDATTVRILRSTVGFATGPAATVNQTIVFDAVGTAFTDSGVTNGTTYFYSLFARDAAGNFSTAATATATPAGDSVAPGPVTALSLTAGDGLVGISFVIPADATGARILRSTARFAFDAEDTTSQTRVAYVTFGQYVDTGVVNNTQYFYTVFARDNSNNYSIAAKATVTPCVPDGGTTPYVDAGAPSPTVDAGTQVYPEQDAGTVTPDPEPEPTAPEEEEGGQQKPPAGGCSSTSGLMASFSLLAVAAFTRRRRYVTLSSKVRLPLSSGLRACHRAGRLRIERRPTALFAAEQTRKKRTAMATGTVKWFNDAKGFGFLTQDGGGEDVFCHHTAIQSDGFRTLAEGQKVEFDVAKGPKGLQAQNVRVKG